MISYISLDYRLLERKYLIIIACSTPNWLASQLLDFLGFKFSSPNWLGFLRSRPFKVWRGGGGGWCVNDIGKISCKHKCVHNKIMHTTTVKKILPRTFREPKKHGTRRTKYHAYTLFEKKIPNAYQITQHPSLHLKAKWSPSSPIVTFLKVISSQGTRWLFYWVCTKMKDQIELRTIYRWAEPRVHYACAQ